MLNRGLRVKCCRHVTYPYLKRAVGKRLSYTNFMFLCVCVINVPESVGWQHI